MTVCLDLEKSSLPKVSHISVHQTWISKLSIELGVEPRYNIILMERLYKCMSLVVSKVKKPNQQEGCQKKKYLQKEWATHLSSKDKKTCDQDDVEKQPRSKRDSLMKKTKGFEVIPVLCKVKSRHCLVNYKKLVAVDLYQLRLLQNENYHLSTLNTTPEV